jgi:hypothetical protein
MLSDNTGVGGRVGRVVTIDFRSMFDPEGRVGRLIAIDFLNEEYAFAVGVVL